MSAEDALVRLAQDLIEEIAAGRAVELAQQAARAVTTPDPAPAPIVIRRGAGAVHPRLGWHLVTRPGDTMSGLAYQHLLEPPGAPIART